jgi:hypothetical protein
MHSSILVSVAEISSGIVIMSLQNLLTPVSLCVVPLEVQITADDKDDSDETAGNAGPHARLVSGQLVLLTEHQATSDTAETTETNESGAAESSLPLTTDVVGLERHGGGDVAIGACSDEEDTKVSDAGALGPAHDGKSDEAKQHVEENARTSDVVLVTDPSCREHDDTGKGVRRRNETLGGSDAEAHVSDEQDGQGVSKGVADGGGVEEDHSIGPDLPVGAAAKEFANLERRNLGIATITTDAINDPLALTKTEERPCLAFRVGEINEKPVTGNTKGDSQGTFDDEDPSPAGETLATVELHKLWSEM